MKLHEMIKETLNNHKSKIELIQWAIISGVSSLLYSEYIANIKQKQIPVRKILLPSIKTLNELLSENSQFIELLSDKLIDNIYNNELFKKYNDAPELVLFNEENIEILKTIFDLYIIPNIRRRIPEAIEKKFDLKNPQQQLFVESREIDLFNRKPINEDQINFIIEETVLQLLILLPTMKKDIELPETNNGILFAEDDIITIGNENAICPIHFNENIFKIESIMKLLSFVTNTTVTENDWNLHPYVKNGNISEPINYIINTGLFNQVSITRFKGIEIQKSDNESSNLEEPS